MAGVASSSRQRSKIAPYLMILHALVSLGIFFVVPFFSLARTSLSSSGGSVYLPTLTFNWDFGNYLDAFSHYQDQIIRIFTYALAATVLCVLLAFPLAYVIAFKAGRYKNLILGLVILPFFVTFVIRTIAWKSILADDGWVVSALGAVGLLPSEGRLLSTSWAVIGGLTYNWIIFMILPLYVSLEKIDPRLIEASKDLYSSNRRSFTKVILPLSMPGVLAGSLLVFIPASGDFINADYLGSTQTTMIGNVIQKQFLVVKDYPAAAALSMVLTAITVVLGRLLAIALVRQRFRGRTAVDTFLVLPLTSCEVVIGAALLTLFLDLAWATGYTTIVIAHVAFEISFIAMTVRARMRGFDWTLEDASMDLGASPARTFFKVTLPLIVPGIVAAAMLSFALSLDDFIITYFVSGSTGAYPPFLNAAVKAAVPPQINVLATAILLISLILLSVGTLYRRKRIEG